MRQIKGWSSFSYYPYTDGYILGTNKEPPRASATLVSNITFGGFIASYPIGVEGVLIFTQDAVGGHTIDWSGKITFVGDPNLNLGANAVSIFDIVNTSSGWIGTKRGVTAVAGPPGPPGPSGTGTGGGSSDVTSTNTITLTNKTLTNPGGTAQALLDSTINPITWDAQLGQIAYLNMQGNRTVALPLNLKRGRYTLYVTQDGTGSRLLTFASGYLFTTPIVLSTAANARDVIEFVSDGTFMYGWMVYKGASATAPAPTPAPGPAPAPTPAPGPVGAPTSAPYMPFGSRLDLTGGAYPFGIMPNNYTPAQMDARVQTCYNAWKAARLKSAPAFTPTSGIFNGVNITDAYYVDCNGDAGAFSVSEGHGYGMLITVVMAGYDANAKAIFDGMYRLARGKPAYGMPTTGGANIYLMEWNLATANLVSNGGGYNATDGDLDIALALLMADRQWGSGGAINYRAQAINTITAMKAVNFNSSGLMQAPQNVSRTSDYMIGHFRSFKKATNDVFWDNARSASLYQIQNIVANFSPVAKLQPGFIYDPMGTPRPDNVARIDGSGIEDKYDGNAVRNPWRWGTDFVWSGDTSWGTIASGNVAAIKNDSGGDPNQTSYGYNLDGTPLSGRYFDPGMNGCIMVGAMCNSANQNYLNTLFTASSGQFNTGYYSGELQLIPLFVASGNWWLPY